MLFSCKVLKSQFLGCCFCFLFGLFVLLFFFFFFFFFLFVGFVCLLVGFVCRFFLTTMCKLSCAVTIEKTTNKAGEQNSLDLLVQY